MAINIMDYLDSQNPAFELIRDVSKEFSWLERKYNEIINPLKEHIENREIDLSNLDINSIFYNSVEFYLGSLAEKEEDVVRKLSGINSKSKKYTPKEIAREYDQTTSRISQIKIKSFRKLRHPSRYENLWRNFRKNLIDKIYFP